MGKHLEKNIKKISIKNELNSAIAQILYKLDELYELYELSNLITKHLEKFAKYIFLIII